MKILIYSVIFCFTASLKLLQLPLTSCLPSFRHSLPFAIIAEINRTLKCRIRLVSLRRQRRRYRLVQCRNFAIYLPKFSCGQIKWPECFKLQSFCFVLFISCLPLLTLPVLHHLVLPLCQLLEVWSNHKTLKGDAGARVSSTAFRLGSPITGCQVARSPGRYNAWLPGCLVVVRSPAQQAGRRQVPRRIIANHLSNKWTKSRYATTNESRVELRWVRALTATNVQWAEVHIFWRHQYIFR